MFWPLVGRDFGGSKLLIIVAKGAGGLTYFMVASGWVLVRARLVPKLFFLSQPFIASVNN